jgi:hypothetical protein
MAWYRSRPLRILRARSTLFALLIFSLPALPSALRAETIVTGSADAVRLDARNAPLSEVLDVIAGKFKVQYQTKIALARPVNGTFRGQLGRVLSRLLDGYDHVVKSGPDGFEVMILGLSSKSASPGESAGTPLPGRILRVPAATAVISPVA